MRAVALLAGAITACALSAWSAAASDQRARLVGYQDFEFGASEADVRARIKVRKEESDKSGGIWLYSTETDQIDGNAYSLDFNVKDGSLVQVNLSRSSGENPVACALTFADVLAHLQSKYGAPDERPDLYKT